MQTKGIIFDMDGLIFDTEALVYKSSQQAADSLAMAYDKQTYLRYLGISDEEFVEKIHADFDEQYGAEIISEFVRRAYANSEAMFSAGLVELKPGVRELLAYLDEQGITRILASSNNRPAINRLLAQAELAEEFPVVVSANDVSRAKPDPEIFLLAAEKLALPRENLLVLEDSKHGVNAAFAADIPVIMVPDLLGPDDALTAKTAAVLPDLLAVRDWLKHN
ncbi:HAD family hydrolase [Enterococcus sp. AD013-P3]|uniref:HAD family hydrolase n=1 Tax=Enterococcus sp. AD013-P3 TaxID=3411036 RepID=UPI003B934A44